MHYCEKITDDDFTFCILSGHVIEIGGKQFKDYFDEFSSSMYIDPLDYTVHFEKSITITNDIPSSLTFDKDDTMWFVEFIELIDKFKHNNLDSNTFK
jgi:hypothetical protein